MNEFVTIVVTDGRFRAYVAWPDVRPAPSIVVVQEMLGVNADIRGTCDELASQGYVAISPDLFWRLEPGVNLSDRTDAEWNRGLALLKAFDIDTGIDDVLATMRTARSLDGANGKVGLMGFCLGGLLTFLATARKSVDASVVYYGGGTEKHLDHADDILSPLLMHIGEEDEYISKDAQTAILVALAGNPFARVCLYAGSHHAFARHGGKHFDATAAAVANERTAQFFERHLR